MAMELGCSPASRSRASIKASMGCAPVESVTRGGCGRVKGRKAHQVASFVTPTFPPALDSLTHPPSKTAILSQVLNHRQLRSRREGPGLFRELSTHLCKGAME